MDVKSAFLHGDMEEEIHMRQPKGYTEYSSLVCKLRKYLYGLKKSPRAWYAKMDAFLLSQKFERCSFDCNLHMHQIGGFLLLITLYVDDLLITGGSSAILRNIKSTLSKALSVTNLGSLRQFIGIEVNQKYLWIIITLSRYIVYFLKRFHMTY